MMKKMLVPVLLLFLIQTSSAVFDYLGANEKYRENMEDNFKNAIYSMAPDAGLLEVSCFFWEDHVSMSATIDNTTYDNGANTLLAGLRAYMHQYDMAKWPAKAEIIVKKPGGAYGQSLASGVAYSKWIDDYNRGMKNNTTVAQHILISKFADTVQENIL